MNTPAPTVTATADPLAALLGAIALHRLNSERLLAPDGTVGQIISVYAPNADPQDVQALVRPENPKSYPRRYYAATLRPWDGKAAA